MMYDFIAEFYLDRRNEEPVYKTHLWGINPLDAMAFIESNGFTVDPESTPGYTDYILETNSIDLTGLFSLEDNPELAEIFFEGKECKRVVLHAYEVEPESELRCSFGVEEALWASFTGNKPDSRVTISHMYFPPVVDLPLRCLKEKMGVLTLFEVMDRLQKCYRDYTPEDLEKLQEEFSSGIRRALDLVTAAFQEELDLDGHSQLMHMTAVSIAGKNDDERLVGLLHDIVEDTDCTFDNLLKDGFPKRIVDSLRLLTHDKDTPYMDYVKNICESGDKVALAVKINDLNHNLKRGRAGGHWHHVEKHEKALAYIQEFITNKESHE
jgi:hypothetical protein